MGSEIDHFCLLSVRAVGWSENPGMPVLFGRHNLHSTPGTLRDDTPAIICQSRCSLRFLTLNSIVANVPFNL